MKNNKLLAEYLGEKVKEFTWKDTTVLVPEDCDPIIDWDGFEIWKPNSDWNQLMMVVEKIEEEFYEKLSDAPETPHNGFSLSIGRTVYDEYEAYMPGMGLPAHADTKIEAVYNACVEYVRAKSKMAV